MATTIERPVGAEAASNGMAHDRAESTWAVKRGLAQMLKGGVIMDVVTPDQAKIAEDAGACAVMALERVPADIRKDGGVARMSDPEMIDGIKAAVKIPVMAKARIGHFGDPFGINRIDPQSRHIANGAVGVMGEDGQLLLGAQRHHGHGRQPAGHGGLRGIRFGLAQPAIFKDADLGLGAKLIADNGKVNATVEYCGKINGKWVAVPATVGSQIKGPCSRIDLLKQHAGIDIQAMYPAGAAPKADAWTTDAFLKAAEACQKGGNPFGIGLGTTSDSVDTIGAFFHAFGAVLVDDQTDGSGDRDRVGRIELHGAG